MRGDAGSGVVLVVDGDGVGRLVWLLVVGEHHGQIQGGDPGGMQRDAHEAAVKGSRWDEDRGSRALSAQSTLARSSGIW